MARPGIAVVVGAGTMGADIAAIFAAHRWSVHVVEPADNRWTAARRRISRSLAQIGSRGRPGEVALHATLAGVTWRGVGIVIECAPEKLALKQKLFAELERYARPAVPVASNSSSFPISAIARGLKTRSRMLGLHFFMPAHLVPAVEVVRGRSTDPAVAARCAALMERLGKVPVNVKKDLPGFLANRLQHALMREALAMVERGLATPRDVDNAVRYGFGLRYLGAGPVMQRDLSGLDVHCAAAATMYPNLASNTRPGKTLRRLVARGKLGMKTGEGFYKWTPQSAKKTLAAYERALLDALALLKRHKGG